MSSSPTPSVRELAKKRKQFIGARYDLPDKVQRTTMKIKAIGEEAANAIDDLIESIPDHEVGYRLSFLKEFKAAVDTGVASIVINSPVQTPKTGGRGVNHHERVSRSFVGAPAPAHSSSSRYNRTQSQRRNP